ncbi:MAG: ceramidase domain-containing protein [Pseudomonadota bacterium]
MNWSEQFDIYCERTDFTYWSEPVNALTNAAFLLAALVMAWRLSQTPLDAGRRIAWTLTGILFAIGIGSFLFHTHATQWASLADVTPIGLFILLYLFAVGLHFLRLPWWGAGLVTLAFLPYAYVTVPIFDRFPFFAVSNFYWTVPSLLILFAPFVALRGAPRTAIGMLIGAFILTISISLRTYDMPICETFPLGSHFWWHILNGVMLGWMIEVYRRHMVEHSPDPV